MSKKKRRVYRKDVTVGNGKRKTVRANTKKELDEKVEALKRQVTAGLIVGTGKEKVLDVTEAWLAFHIADREIEQSSVIVYRSIIDNHIKEMFANNTIEDLNERIIVSAMGLRQSLSPSSRRRILLVLRMVIKFAIRRGMIVKDPMEFIRMPSAKPLTDKSQHCLTVEQTKSLIEAVKDTKFENLFVLLALTGMRVGEALALTPDDFSEDLRWVEISKTISLGPDGRHLIREGTKTDAGKRKIPIPQQATDAIRRELVSRDIGPEELIFTNQKGQIQSRRDLLFYYFRPIVQGVGLPKKMTIHDLRHTYATCALNAGIGVHLVSKMLGHASVKVTLDLYSHALPDETASAAKVIEGLFDAGD